MTLKDTGWVTKQPLLGLPAMVLAWGLQLRVVLSSEGMLELVNQLSLFFWLIGNSLWMCSEFLFEEEKPLGFLAHIPQLQDLQEDLFHRLMWIAVTTMSTTCAALAAFYSVALCCYRWRTAPGVDLPFLSLAPAQTGCHQGNEAMGIPMSIYRDLFMIPWLIMDTCWAVCNLRGRTNHPPGLLLIPFAAFGLVAVALGADAVRRHVVARERGESLLCLAELLWVLGNFIWASQDLFFSSFPRMKYGAIISFVLGVLVLTGVAIAAPSSQDVQTKEESDSAALCLGTEARTLEMRSTVVDSVSENVVHSTTEPEGRSEAPYEGPVSSYGDLYSQLRGLLARMGASAVSQVEQQSDGAPLCPGTRARTLEMSGTAVDSVSENVVNSGAGPDGCSETPYEAIQS
eukprot:gnl/TRDRNA2_/TRDRNA2_199029_c0_seq1.p1 gnl/TRDRNA2_/TRDRNA2_199029_c0~~gnl/TRDRNA2_/TRDRNA2_199029_c0_seq1.p1  ORF type:complete len:429 (-),score=49.41 gnl/TRDRNA2_/TRDRNA2_199029_c0_seq1:105-1307(-)